MSKPPFVIAGSAPRLRRLLNLWPPFLGAGIEVMRIAPDVRAIDIRLKRRWYNRNIYGTHFGGSLFAMTDPFFVIMLAHALGREHAVWDQSATIIFRAPARGTVTASFVLDEMTLEAIRGAADQGAKVLHDFTVEVTDDEGRVVASVVKTVYIRKRRSM